MTAPEAVFNEPPAPEGQEPEQHDVQHDQDETQDADKGSVWDDPETARKEGERLRKESAKYRTKVREFEPLAKKWTEKVNSEKSENELLQEQLSKLQDELSTKTRRQIAAEAGMPSEFLPLLTGTEEEMARQAADLAEKYGEKPAHVVTHNRPTPVLRTGQAAVDQSPTMDDLIRGSVRR
jgi:hypothetical protein